MGGAQYIGRVGALAVVLGVGMAVASGHGMGIACADETTDSGTTSTSPQSNTDGDAATSSNEQQQGPSSSTTPSQGVDPADEPADAGSQPSNSPSVPEMNHDNSGSAHISDTAAEEVLAEKPTTPDSDTSKTPATQPLPESTQSTQGSGTNPIEPSST